jgi:hypothetical protein
MTDNNIILKNITVYLQNWWFPILRQYNSRWSDTLELNLLDEFYLSSLTCLKAKQHKKFDHAKNNIVSITLITAMSLIILSAS